MPSENPTKFSPRKKELLRQIAEIHFQGRKPGPSAYLSSLYECSEEYLEGLLKLRNLDKGQS